MDVFEEKVAEWINREGLSQAPRILVAVSGGVDSVALALALVKLSQANRIPTEVMFGHVNHNLRGPLSDGDEQFVQELAVYLAVKIGVRSIDVRAHAQSHSLSIETAGRTLRRKALIEMARQLDCTAIATGHHKNDQAETLVHRLLRGTAFRGLGGIWPKRTFDGTVFVRPLQCVTRNEIMEYCRRSGLNWREDHTNEEVNFTRNRIRHLLLPRLQGESRHNLTEILDRLAQAGRALTERVHHGVDACWNEVVFKDGEQFAIKKVSFQRLSPVVRVELLRRALASLGSGERNLTEEHYRRICALATAPSGKEIELPGGFRAYSERDHFVLTHKDIGCEVIQQPVRLEVPGCAVFGNMTVRAQVLDRDTCNLAEFICHKSPFEEWFDLDRLKLPLSLRFWRPADTLEPLAGHGPKSIGRFVADAQLDDQTRSLLIAVADAKHIIWLCPLRMSETAKVTDRTRRILALSAAICRVDTPAHEYIDPK